MTIAHRTAPLLSVALLTLSPLAHGAAAKQQSTKRPTAAQKNSPAATKSASKTDGRALRPKKSAKPLVEPSATSVKSATATVEAKALTVKAKPATAEVKTALSPATAAAKPKSGIFGWLKANLTTRQEVKDLVSTAEQQRKMGNMMASAESLSLGPNFRGEASQKLGLLERFSLFRANWKQNSTMRKQLDQRSKSGDVEGSKDALGGLEIMNDRGKMNFLSKWHAGRAENGAVANTANVAKELSKGGDFDLAKKNLSFAAEIGGNDNRRVVKGQRAYFKNAMAAADRASHSGDTEGTVEALKMAKEAPGQSSFNQAKADKLIERAHSVSIKMLLKSAKVLARAGQKLQAAAAVNEAMELQKENGVQLGFLDAHSQSRLISKLGAQMAKAREEGIKFQPVAPKPVEPKQEEKSAAAPTESPTAAFSQPTANPFLGTPNNRRLRKNRNSQVPFFNQGGQLIGTVINGQGVPATSVVAKK